MGPTYAEESTVRAAQTPVQGSINSLEREIKAQRETIMFLQERLHSILTQGNSQISGSEKLGVPSTNNLSTRIENLTNELNSNTNILRTILDTLEL